MSEWPRVPLGELGTWFGGGTPSKRRPDYWENGTIPWLSPKDMRAERLTGTRDHITEAAVAESTTRLVPQGSVAVVMRSGILERVLPVAIAPFSTTLNQDMRAVSPFPFVTAEWIAWGIRAHAQAILASSRKAGTTVASLETSRLMQFELPVPAIADQRRIVEILEEHLSRLDAGERFLALATAKLQSTKDAAAIRILLPGADQAPGRASMDVAEDRLLPLPLDWHWRTLGALAEVVGGVTKDAKRESAPGLVEVPYLRVANVQRGRLDLERLATIRVSAGKAEQLRLIEGDVLLNEGGDRDKLARGWVWQNQVPHCIHQNHVFRARPDTNAIEPEWLARATNVLGGLWAERHGKQSVNLASISLSTIRSMPIPMPPLSTQRRRLLELQDFEVTLGRIADAAATAGRRALVLRSAVVAAAFSGRLTGRSSDLDRIEELVP